MAQASLEHVNITVSNAEKTAHWLCGVFDWRVRWTGRAASGGTTFHVGTERAYLAVYQAPGGVVDAYRHGKGAPLNHIGVEVADLNETERRVKAAGFGTFNHGDYAPGRRFYFFDSDGVEWEIVSYA